jgi:hypothetical protein
MRSITRSRRELLAAATIVALGAAALVSAPVAAAADPAPSIRINEVESNGGTPGDWIELLNTGSTDADLSGYVIKDDDDAHEYTLPSGTIIAPGAFLVLDQFDDETSLGSFDFGLGGNDTVRLFDTADTIVDAQAWTSHGQPTWGVHDLTGSTEWVQTATSTKGAANDFATPNVVVNEIVYDDAATGLDDTIELYNVGPVTADLSGWMVTDDKAEEFGVLPSGTAIAPGGFLVLVKDVDFPFGLGKNDSVVLLDTTSTTIDEYAYENTAPVSTWARCPDGTGDWAHATEPTPGAANNCTPIVVPAEPGSILINEVDSQPSDWIEFFNPGDEALDISGYEVRDNSDDHQWRFPVGSSIAAGEFLVVEADAVGLVYNGTDWVSGSFTSAIGIGGGDKIRLYDTTSALIDETGAWTEHAAIDGDAAAATLARCPDGVGEFRLALITKGAANECVPPTVAVNEINSNGTDWVEIVNTGDAPVDVSGWTVMDNDPVGHAADVTPLADGAVLAAGAYLVLTTGIEFGFGLGNGDTVTLRDANGTTVDEHAYPEHAAGFWARCPDGTGAFEDVAAGTPGAKNTCDGSGPEEPEEPELPLGVWPGGAEVTVLDPEPTFFEDSSGLDSEQTAGGGVLWAIDNGTGTFWKLDVAADGSVSFADGWDDGKRIRFQKDAANPGAAGPDTEGITAAGDGFIYAASERDNSAKAVNWNVVLKVDPAAAGPDLVALQEWDLTASLPAVGANLGIEAVEWVADSALTGRLWDDSTSSTYDPADYPLHGDGLFFVAVEDGGGVFGFALNTDGTFDLVATIDPGLTGVMALDYDSVLGSLWAVCDNGCGTAAAIITLNGTVDPSIAHVARPAGLPDVNNEGFATAPIEIDADGTRPAWWFADGFAAESLHLGTLTAVDLPPTGVDPAPVPDAELTEGSRGTVTAPSTAIAGSTVVVTVGEQYAGQTVRVWLHSTPTLLGELVVSATGTVSVTVPVPTAVGDHRVVVASPTNELIGWAPMRVVVDVVLPPTGVDPAPVPDAELTQGSRGPVTAPSTVNAGSTMVVTVGEQYAGQSVRVWLHSVPVLLGELVVSATGTVSVTVPVLTAAGDHRVVVASMTNELIGWAPVRVVVAAGVAQSLEKTGAENGWMGGAAIAGILLLGLGGALAAVRRRTTRRAG